MNQNIANLIRKQLCEQLTSSEEKQLNFWLNNPNNQKLYLKIISSEKSKLEAIDWVAKNKLRIFSEIKRKSNRNRLLRVMKYAAFYLILLMLGISIVKDDKEQVKVDNIAIKQYDVPVLTLPSGEKHKLVKSEAFEFDVNRSVNIKNDDGTLNFNQLSKDQLKNHFSTLETPYGKDYKLQLSDGTHVHLNANSKITFPTLFSGDQRIVKIEGHVFFDVAHNDEMPFIVQSNDLTIRVLGTKFDIEAYKNDKIISATLLEGSIESHVKGSNKIVIEPDQQIVYDMINKKISVKQVNAFELLSWTEGKFSFIDNKLENVMMKVGRWYGVKIKWETEEAKNRLVGLKLSKEKSLNDVIQYFEESLNICIVKEGNNLIVKK